MRINFLIIYLFISLFSLKDSYGQELIKKRGDNYLWGYVNSADVWIIPPMYDNTNEFHEELAYVEKQREFKGFINKEGKQIIDFNKKYYLTGSGNYKTLSGYDFGFKNGFFIVQDQKTGKTGLINKSGVLIVSGYFDVREFSEGFAAVEIYGPLWGYVNSKGQEVITPKYNEASNFSEGIAKVGIGNYSKMKYGFIGSTFFTIGIVLLIVIMYFTKSNVWVVLPLGLLSTLYLSIVYFVSKSGQ